MKIIICLLQITKIIRCMYDSNESQVLRLDHSNFDSLVIKSKSPILVEFYAPWCGHCQKLEEPYSKAAKSLEKVNLKIGAVDCDNKDNQQLCSKYNVKGFPTLKMFPSLIKSKSKKTKSPVDYNGGRDQKSIESFVKSYIPNLVKKLSEKAPKAIETFIESNKAKVVLFSKKAETPALLKSLALEFNDKVDFAIFDSKQKHLLAALNIDEKEPALVYLDKEVKTEVQINEKLVKYQGGKLSYQKIKKFITQQLRKDSFDLTKQEVSIKELTDQEVFENECLYGGHRMCLVGALDPKETEVNEKMLKYLSYVKEEISDVYVTWLDTKKQTKFTKQFEITTNKNTADIILINHFKRRFFKMPIEQENGLENKLLAFVQNALDGSLVKNVNKYRFSPGLKKTKKQSSKNNDKASADSEKDEL